MKRIFSWIPNTITCLNLVAGVVATIYALKFGFAHDYQYAKVAYCCIGAAAVFDFLDGFMARLLKAYSDLGKELDSLSDLVSFGVAPGCLVFSLISQYPGAGWTAWFALLIPVMGALRLARFNIDTRQTTSFIGLPIPANAIFWIGAVDFTAHQLSNGAYSPVAAWLLYLAILAVSLLMVSNVKMFSLKFKNLDWRENFRRYAIIVAAVLFVIFCGWAGLAWTIILYLILSALLPQQ